MKPQKPSWFITNVPWEIKKIIWKLWESGVTINDTLTYLEKNSQGHPVYSRHTIGRVREELTKLPVGKIIQLLSELPEIREFVLELRPDYAEHELHEEEQRVQDSDELSTTALVIASNLEKYRNFSSPSEKDPLSRSVYTVRENVYGGWWIFDDQARLGDVDKKAAERLLKCLKEEGEISELEDIKDWAELKDDIITENFIQRLISRAHRGNFGETRSPKGTDS